MMPWLLLALAATHVEVVSSGCSFAGDEVRRIAAIELGRGPSAAHVVATVVCQGETLLVRVDDSVTQKTLERRLPLGALKENTRARYAALAIAELVEASWSELLLPAPPAIEPALRREVVQALPSRRVRLGVAAMVRAFVTRGVVQGGVAARAEVALAGPLGLWVDVGVAHGEVRLSNGRVSADSLDGALFATLSGEWGPVLLGGGLGARAGGARLVGTPDDPAQFIGGTVSSALVGPAGRVEAALRFGWFEVALGLEVGVAVLRLEAFVDGRAATGLTGAWVSGTLGLGVRL